MFHHQRHEESKTALWRAVISGEKELIENKWQVFFVCLSLASICMINLQCTGFNSESTGNINKYMLAALVAKH